MSADFEPGNIVTLLWARDYPEENAPLFILLNIPYSAPPAGDGHMSIGTRNYTRNYGARSGELALAYCYFDPTDNGWVGLTWTLAITQLIRVRRFYRIKQPKQPKQQEENQ